MATYTIYSLPADDHAGRYTWSGTALVPTLDPSWAYEGQQTTDISEFPNAGFITNVGIGDEIGSQAEFVAAWQSHIWFDTSIIDGLGPPTYAHVVIYNDGVKYRDQQVRLYVASKDVVYDSTNWNLMQQPASKVKPLPLLSSKDLTVGTGGFQYYYTDQNTLKWVSRTGMTKLLVTTREYVEKEFLPHNIGESTAFALIFADYGGTTFPPSMYIETMDTTVTSTTGVTIAPTSTGVNGWTTPANAYASDGIYATASPGRNGLVSGIWQGWNTTSIPANAVAKNITATATYNVSTTAALATVTLNVLLNGAVVSTVSDTTEPAANTTMTLTPAVTLDDIRTGRATLQVQAQNGATNTAVTVSLDYVGWTLDFDSGPPAGIVLTPDNVLGNVAVSWTAVTGATGYNIYRNGIYSGTVSAGLTTFTDQPPATGKYSYGVSYLNSSRVESDISQPTLVDVTVPFIPFAAFGMPL